MVYGTFEPSIFTDWTVYGTLELSIPAEIGRFVDRANLQRIVAGSNPVSRSRN